MSPYMSSVRIGAAFISSERGAGDKLITWKESLMICFPSFTWFYCCNCYKINFWLSWNYLRKPANLVADVLEHAGVLLPFCVGVGRFPLHGGSPQAGFIWTLHGKSHSLESPRRTLTFNSSCFLPPCSSLRVHQGHQRHCPLSGCPPSHRKQAWWRGQDGRRSGRDAGSNVGDRSLRVCRWNSAGYTAESLSVRKQRRTTGRESEGAAEDMEWIWFLYFARNMLCKWK